LHTLPLDIPPSQLWSPELKDWYAKFALQSFEHPLYPIPNRDAPASAWAQLRAWDEGEMAQPLAADLKRYRVVIEETQLAGVHAAVITPEGGISPENQHRVLINLRGGGFVLNSGLSFGKLESIPVAALGRIKVVTLDYRQAPQHQYPAATEDVEAVYRHLLKTYGPNRSGSMAVRPAECLRRSRRLGFRARTCRRRVRSASSARAPARGSEARGIREFGEQPRSLPRR
jgi:acetyl esterase/lipase